MSSIVEAGHAREQPRRQPRIARMARSYNCEQTMPAIYVIACCVRTKKTIPAGHARDLRSRFGNAQITQRTEAQTENSRKVHSSEP
jgi:hypothetical protein